MKKLLSISPILFLSLIFLICSFSTYKVPVIVIFLIVSAYSIVISGGKVDVFSNGAANSRIMYMIWIFVLAGAFASVAKQIGAVNATVNLTLNIIPSGYLPLGLFIASCFISFSIGTSVGTIVALCPIAVGLASNMSESVALYTAIVVGGAFFGDNLSFISDTTIAATQTQHCQMKDKFKSNFLLVLPAAIITSIIYLLSTDTTAIVPTKEFDLVLIIPYIIVIVLALFGVKVLTLLSISLLITIVIGILSTDIDLGGCFDAIVNGVSSMSELILVTMMAGGILGILKYNGGLDYAIEFISKRVHTKSQAEMAIVEITAIANLCTANNTIAILSVGDISKKISESYGVSGKRSASLMDTTSCFIQGIIPYGAQLLMASNFAEISPISIIPYLYYPFFIGVSIFISIFTNINSRKTATFV